jgi:putative transposase
MTVELEWMEGKLKSLDSSNKKDLIEPKLKTVSISRQCVLIVNGGVKIGSFS